MAETLEFTDIPIPPDLAPPGEYEYACEVCGKELFYGGKGRKPKKCDQHKTAVGRKGSGTNANLARQASAALSQYNSLICVGLMIPPPNPVCLPRTASAIAVANDGFEEQAYNALLTDPGLCKMILKAGGVSGKLLLLVAYGMLAVAVVPVGVEEYRESHPKEPAELRAV